MELPPVYKKLGKLLETKQTHFILSRDDIYWAIQHYLNDEELIYELHKELNGED